VTDLVTRNVKDFTDLGFDRVWDTVQLHVTSTPIHESLALQHQGHVLVRLRLPFVGPRELSSNRLATLAMSADGTLVDLIEYQGFPRSAVSRKATATFTASKSCGAVCCRHSASALAGEGARSGPSEARTEPPQHATRAKRGERPVEIRLASSPSLFPCGT
jgi:hypothetical protein